MLRDRVPRGKFQYLDGATDWGQGRANLYNPFRLPSDDSYFANFTEDKIRRAEQKTKSRIQRVKRKKAAKRMALANAVAISIIHVLCRAVDSRYYGNTYYC
mmetsp:Transcript_7674/g.17152  ORF Transcript_7674/g.17152 Transcript_7674/m.17152 type:complete len:101 (-) Transcript_7674:61-363(-)